MTVLSAHHQPAFETALLLAVKQTVNDQAAIPDELLRQPPGYSSSAHGSPAAARIAYLEAELASAKASMAQSRVPKAEMEACAPGLAGALTRCKSLVEPPAVRRQGQSPKSTAKEIFTQLQGLLGPRPPPCD